MDLQHTIKAMTVNQMIIPKELASLIKKLFKRGHKEAKLEDKLLLSDEKYCDEKKRRFILTGKCNEDLKERKEEIPTDKYVGPHATKHCRLRTICHFT